MNIRHWFLNIITGVGLLSLSGLGIANKLCESLPGNTYTATIQGNPLTQIKIEIIGVKKVAGSGGGGMPAQYKLTGNIMIFRAAKNAKNPVFEEVANADLRGWNICVEKGLYISENPLFMTFDAAQASSNQKKGTLIFRRPGYRLHESDKWIQTENVTFYSR